MLNDYFTSKKTMRKSAAPREKMTPFLVVGGEWSRKPRTGGRAH
jgi:hypothetical protein